MPTPLQITEEFPASPAAVFALFCDTDFVAGRLADSGALEPEVVSLETGGVAALELVTQQSIPADALPSMVAPMIGGDPQTRRTETWQQDGDSYRAELAVTVKGAPASLKGTMTLTPTDTGSTLTVDAFANVPIPMFGAKIEEVIVEQISHLLRSEGNFTRGKLAQAEAS